MLDLTPPMRLKAAPNDRVVRPNQFERRAVALKPRRHLGRTDDVGEHDGAQSGIDRGRSRIAGRPRIADPAEERLDGDKVDRNDRVGDLAMRLTMDLLCGSLIGRMDEAKGGAVSLVEPVGHILDPVPVLDVDIPAVRLGDVRLLHSTQVVAVHEDRQAVSLVRQPSFPGRGAG